MSGGVMGSKAGTLTFMLGAPSNQPEFLKRAEKTLLMMGKRVIHMGPQGAGLAGKLANNYLLAISNIATAEAMNLGLKLGLQPETLAELINSSSGKCWSSEINNPVPGINPNAPASKDYLGGFGLGLMRKDLRLAIEAAKAADAKLVLGDEATKIYRDAEKSEGVKDFSVIYRWLGGKSKPNV
jgi:3-hydroxyisobutyrate dehydrogenase-like beta-hydroxyacid dehydrogenase